MHQYHTHKNTVENPKISPSCVEEQVCAEAESMLLIDEEGSMINNDESMFAKKLQLMATQ